MFFCAKGMNPIQTESSPGVHAIGSGSVPAMNQLNTRGQNLSYSLSRTIYHVHEAMKSAQNDPTADGFLRIGRQSGVGVCKA
jgi:hypothetical protein